MLLKNGRRSGRLTLGKFLESLHHIRKQVNLRNAFDDGARLMDFLKRIIVHFVQARRPKGSENSLTYIPLC